MAAKLVHTVQTYGNPMPVGKPCWKHELKDIHTNGMNVLATITHF